MKLYPDCRALYFVIIWVPESRLGPNGGLVAINCRASEIAESDVSQRVQKNVSSTQIGMLDVVFVDMLEGVCNISSPFDAFFYRCGAAIYKVLADSPYSARLR
jgi:hypothetical protein